MLDLAFLQRALLNGSCYYYTCLVNESPTGYLSAYRFPDVLGNGYHVYLFTIDVAAQFQRRGIDTALIAALKRDCIADGVSHIWVGTSVDNVAAQRLYASTGGRLTETGVEYIYELSKVA